MRTLNIEISELEYEKFGIENDQLSFTDFIDMVSREISRQNLKKSIELAGRYGLANMTMDEISAEVKAVRNRAAHSSRQRSCICIDPAKLSILYC